MTSEEQPERTCPNCDAVLHGPFCAACGQNNEFERLRTRDLLGRAIEHLFELDSPIFRTLRGLTIRPGHVCREYVTGHWGRYTNPLKYLVVTAAIYVFVVVVFDVSPSAAIVGAAETPARLTADGDLNRSWLSFRARELVDENFNIISFFAVPLTALAPMLLFRRVGMTYAEHLAFMLLIVGHLFLFYAAAGLAGLFSTRVGVGVAQVVEIAYFSWAGAVFYRIGVVSTTWRMVLVWLANFFITGLLATIFVTGWISIQFFLHHSG